MAIDRNPKGKPELGDEVRRRMKVADLNPKQTAARLDDAGRKYGYTCSESAVKRMMSKNTFSKGAPAALAEVFGFEQKTEEAFNELYYAKWTRWSPPNSEPGTMAALMDQIAAVNEKAFRYLVQAGSLTPEVFRHMGANHFFVSTTTNLKLMVFQQKDFPEMVESRAQAITCGALFATIMPTERLSGKLRDDYQLHGGESFAGFKSGFDDFRATIAKRLKAAKKGLSLAVALRDACRRMQRFEWDEFPLCPAGWTVSLFGERHQSRSEPHLRVIVRGLFHNRDALLLWPSTDGRFEVWMRSFIDRVLTAREKDLTSQGEKSDFCEVDDELYFIRCLRCRMYGDPDPDKPS